MKQKNMTNVYGSLIAFAIVITVIGIKIVENDSKPQMATAQQPSTQDNITPRAERISSPIMKTSGQRHVDSAVKKTTFSD